MKKITLVIMLLIILSGCDTKTYSDPKIEPNTQPISNTNCEKRSFKIVILIYMKQKKFV